MFIQLNTPKRPEVVYNEMSQDQTFYVETLGIPEPNQRPKFWGLAQLFQNRNSG